MTITITIADAAKPQILGAIAAAQNWPRGNDDNTAERVSGYMLTTVAQWVKTGTEIMAREAAEAALANTVAAAVTIDIE